MIVDLHSSSSKNGCVVLNELLAGGDRFEGAQLPATSARLDRSLLGMHLNSKPFFIQDRTQYQVGTSPFLGMGLTRRKLSLAKARPKLSQSSAKAQPKLSQSSAKVQPKLDQRARSKLSRKQLTNAKGPRPELSFRSS